MDFEETHLQAPGGASLFLRRATMQEPALADVIHVHGMGEHSARYVHVADGLAKRGVRFCTYDLRGHGRSSGRRGDIVDYSELLDDLQLVWDHYSGSGLPAFLYGHSLGGQIAINFAVQRRPHANGIVAASPWLALVYRPKCIKLVLARILRRLWPTFTQHTGMDLSRLSRDHDFLASMRDLHLTHRAMSARMFHQLTRGALTARQSAKELQMPTLLLHGDEDPITSVVATKRFFEASAASDKTLKIYPGTLHETHNDTHRLQVIEDIATWICQRAKGTIQL